MIPSVATAMLKLEFVDPDFFAIDPKKLSIEAPAQSGRTYFVFKGRIVAVAQADRRSSDVE